MSSRWMKTLEGKIEKVDADSSARIQALTRENRDLSARVAALEKTGEPEEEDLSLPAARVPGRPAMMKEMGYGGGQ